MCTHGLPDIYTLSPRASGVYIRQTTRAHGITTKYILYIYVYTHTYMNFYYVELFGIYLYVVCRHCSSCCLLGLGWYIKNGGHWQLLL